jgi:hypothetical protein
MSKLAEELAALEDRVRRMETLLRGAESVLSSIRYDSSLSYTPADGDCRTGHRRACDLIEFLGEQVTAWRRDEAELDFAADDVGKLAELAENGKLIRYGKVTPE